MGDAVERRAGFLQLHYPHANLSSVPENDALPDIAPPET